MAEEPTDSAAGDTDPEEVQQEEFQPALTGPTAPVKTEMANSDDDRHDREGEDADGNTVYAVPSSSDIAWMLPSHVLASDSSWASDPRGLTAWFSRAARLTLRRER